MGQKKIGLPLGPRDLDMQVDHKRLANLLEQLRDSPADAPGVTLPEGAAATPHLPRWKRGLDLCCILLSLPLWLPLMGLIALGIRSISPGPVFFRQQRIGRGGQPFTCLKFRSMKINAQTQSHELHLQSLMASQRPLVKLDDTGDPRLIPLGRLFRASGLDELPQIFNVLRGEMSLVGPRPCTVYEFENLKPWHRLRLSTLPGLTGFWQVNGKNRTSFDEMIAMDIFYAKHQSLGLDLSIMLKTFPAVGAQLLASRRSARH